MPNRTWQTEHIGYLPTHSCIGTGDLTAKGMPVFGEINILRVEASSDSLLDTASPCGATTLVALRSDAWSRSILIGTLYREYYA
jgi:hypothetical protein